MAKAAIRSFRWDDLEDWTDLFNEVNEFTGSAKAFDPELSRQFLSQPLCKPEENCFIAERDGSMAGFAIVSPELPISRAVASGGVSPDHRRMGIGCTLLRAGLDRAADLGVSVLHVQTRSDRAPATRLLESSGFRPVRTYCRMTWQGDTVADAEIPAGYSLRTFAETADSEALTRLQNAAFADSWGFSPNSVEDVEARLGFKTSPHDGILLVMDDSEQVAYNWTFYAAGDSESIGRVSMTGVHPDHRGRGLGRAVLLAGIQSLMAKGVDQIELEVDHENFAASELYRSVGFTELCDTQWYELGLG